MKKQYIYTAFTTLFLIGTPVFADIILDNDNTVPYFASSFKINQDIGISVVAVPLSKAKGTPSGFTPDGRYEKLKIYDRRLPFVNYSIRKPQELKKYLDRQISQEAKKLGVKNINKITLEQSLLTALQVTNANLSYETQMVAANPNYNRKLDDKISALPLDDVIMKQKRGVCRQYAAVFEVVFERIAKISKSPHIRYAIVDEVLSYDLNHTYTVVYIPLTNDRIQVVFVEPIGSSTLAQADALDGKHDALYVEFATNGRWTMESGEKEALLASLAENSRYGALIQKQAQTELLSLANEKILNQITDDSFTQGDSQGVRAASLAPLSTVASSTVKLLDERYNRTKAIYDQIQRLASIRATAN